MTPTPRKDPAIETGQTSENTSRTVLLSSDSLSFSYGQDKVLDTVTIKVNAGETVGVIGPNGSGKSTLLKLLGGILPDPSNSVSFQNSPITSINKRQLAKNIAWIPQDNHLAFPFKVQEVVLMGRHPYLGPFSFEDENDLKIAERAMEITDTLTFATRSFNDISGGEKQRVMMASAIAQEPQLMLLDEPTSALDIKYQMQILEILNRLNLQRGMTLILAMHDLHLASKFCQRLILLKAGRIIRDGKPQEVLQKEILEEVYGISVKLFTDPDDGSILISPEAL